MANTLTNGATVLTLPIDLQWADEFAWTPIAEQRNFSMGGAVLVDRGTRLAGRPITLQGGENFGWMTRADILTLKAWADTLFAPMTLLFRGVTYEVAFDHASNGPLLATPVIDVSDPDNTDLYWPVLRLITTE